MTNVEEDCDAQPNAVVDRQAMQVSAQRRKATFFMVSMSKSSSNSDDTNEARCWMLEDFLIVYLPVCLCRVSVLYMRVGWSIIICQEVKNFYFIDYFGAIHAMNTDIFVVSD